MERAGRGANRIELTARSGGGDPSRSELAVERSRRRFADAVAALRGMGSERPEAARDAALAALAEAAREQDAFLHAAAHDLRNPLTAIRGQAQLLRRRVRRAELPETEAARLDEGMAGIEAAADRLETLIDCLLDAGWLGVSNGNDRPTPGSAASGGTQTPSRE